MALFQVKPTLQEEIIRSQPKEPVLRKSEEELRCGRRSDYSIKSDGALQKEKRLCVPHVKVMKDDILEEAHSLAYAMHPRSTKMFKTLKSYY